MDFDEKVRYAISCIDAVARSGRDVPVDTALLALDRIASYARVEAVATARAQLPTKVAIAVDDTALRRLIEIVREARGVVPELESVEAALGAMLPPATGRLRVTTAEVVLTTRS